MRLDAAEARKRALTRDRVEERQIPLEYYESLNSRMDVWMEQCGSKVAVINAAQEKEQVLRDVKAVLESWSVKRSGMYQ